MKHISIPCEECGCNGVLTIIWKIGVFHCPSCGCYSLGTVKKVKDGDQHG